MSAPNVTRRGGETYPEARQRASAMNRSVANLLGWRLGVEDFKVSEAQWVAGYGDRDAPNPRPGIYTRQVWIRPDGGRGQSIDTEPNECLPDWQGDLNKAWELHRERPDGTTLFALSWLDFVPGEVAYRICETFVEWKRKLG